MEAYDECVRLRFEGKSQSAVKSFCDEVRVLGLFKTGSQTSNLARILFRQRLCEKSLRSGSTSSIPFAILVSFH